MKLLKAFGYASLMILIVLFIVIVETALLDYFKPNEWITLIFFLALFTFVIYKLKL